MSLQRKLKIALDETRLLILGVQVLFGAVQPAAKISDRRLQELADHLMFYGSCRTAGVVK